jgi:hypothetical protein
MPRIRPIVIELGRFTRVRPWFHYALAGGGVVAAAGGRVRYFSQAGALAIHSDEPVSCFAKFIASLGVRRTGGGDEARLVLAPFTALVQAVPFQGR